MSDTERRRKDQQGMLLIGAVAAVFLILVLFSLFAKKEVTDKQTLCPKSGPRGAVAIITDLTDSLTKTQILSVSNELGVGEISSGTLLEKIPEKFEVRVFSIPGTLELVEGQVRGICNPGDGKKLNELYENPALAKKRWSEAFSEPLKDKLKSALSVTEEAKSSPILETIQIVSLGFLNRPDLRDKPRWLVVISDMLQNTPSYSQFSDDRSYEQLRQTSEFSSLRTALNGVEVSILYVRRSKFQSLQGAKHIKFWESYFRDMGAHFSERIAVKSIEG